MDQKILPPILIYYSFRGQLQPIRNLFCYMDILFHEVHLDSLQQLKKTLPQAIIQQVRKFKVDKNQLPALIHNGLIIYNSYPIAAYSCRQFNHLYLFGINLRMRSRVQELLYIYFFKQPQSMVELFKYADFAANNNEQEINHYARKLYLKFLNESQYIKEFCQFVDQQDSPQFVLGRMSLVDFYFMETCNYMLGMFNDQKRINSQIMKEGLYGDQKGDKQPCSTYYLEIMKKYHQRINNQPFYIKHKDYLESFSIVSTSSMNAERALGFRKMWVGNKKLVA